MPSGPETKTGSAFKLAPKNVHPGNLRSSLRKVAALVDRLVNQVDGLLYIYQQKTALQQTFKFGLSASSGLSLVAAYLLKTRQI